MLLAAGCSDTPSPVDASMAVAEAMAGDTAGYARATSPRPFVWPADHGPHHDFRVEWWYATGNLRATDGSGRRFGYQFTIFRTALANAQGEVEFTGIKLRQLRETLAQSIEPGKARLQLGDVHSECIELTLSILTHGANLLALLIECLGQRGVDHRFDCQPLGTQRGTGAKAQDQQQDNR